MWYYFWGSSRGNYNTKASIIDEIQLRDDYVNSILNQIKSDASVYDKIVYLNEWLTLHNEYNTDLRNCRKIKSQFILTNYNISITMYLSYSGG